MMIRYAVPDDTGPVAEIYVKNHREVYRGLLPDEYFSVMTQERAADKWREYLKDSDRKLWVACEGNTLLGFAAGMKDPELPDTWYLDSLHTSSDARGRGIGTSLIRTVCDYAAENGYSRVSVCIVKGNERAKALYLKLGAEHYKDFDDDFCGTVSHSEKLIWNGPCK